MLDGLPMYLVLFMTGIFFFLNDGGEINHKYLYPPDLELKKENNTTIER